MSQWVNIQLQANIDSSMTLYCFCKRKLKEHKGNDEGLYCRKHGLQALIKSVARQK